MQMIMLLCFCFSIMSDKVFMGSVLAFILKDNYIFTGWI